MELTQKQLNWLKNTIRYNIEDHLGEADYFREGELNFLDNLAEDFFEALADNKKVTITIEE